MPRGVYTRKPKVPTPAPEPAQHIVVRRASPQSKRQAQEMLRMASAQLHALAMNIQLISNILGVQDGED